VRARPGFVKWADSYDVDTKSENWLSEREVGSLAGDEDGPSTEERETVNVIHILCEATDQGV